MKNVLIFQDDSGHAVFKQLCDDLKGSEAPETFSEAKLASMVNEELYPGGKSPVNFVKSMKPLSDKKYEDLILDQIW